jgi:NAD-dependent dihydropyrimidine dehydrogenase PreA subunit
MKITQHPTYLKVRGQASPPRERIDLATLRQWCLDAGADDVGFVALDRPAFADDIDDIRRALPSAKSLVAFVVRTNRDPIRSPARSVANLEFHQTADVVEEVGRRLVRILQLHGARAINPSVGFPMEMARFPGKSWVVSHKTVAVEAGLGQMGIHRNVIHPRFGNFILLGTVITDLDLGDTEQSRPIDYNPCLECKLCVSACPVGAIKSDGRFDFSACYVHNYREFMSGFTSWVEQIADSKDARDYRKRVTDVESASMWQSLAFGANYKAAYCMAVCPAGEDVIGPFVADRKQFLADVVRPLQREEETVYVLQGSDAQTHVAKRFPHKTARVVRSALRPRDIPGFLRGITLTFQSDAAGDLDACFHFVFTGAEQLEATVAIRNGRLAVQTGRHGEPDLLVTADARTWIDFLAHNRGLIGALLLRKIKLSGPPSLLRRFAACFPS